MLPIKNGLKCSLRTPGKTLLFLLILTVIATLLTVSYCVFAAVRGYLKDCDAYFHTIAELEYIGQSYPDRMIYDADMARAVEQNREILDGLAASDEVLSFEPASSEYALSPLIRRWDNQVPDPSAAVLHLNLISYDERLGLFNAIVAETYYSRKDYTDKLILFQPTSDAEELRSAKNIIVAGRYFTGSMPNPCLQQETVSLHEGGRTVRLPAYREASALEPGDPFLRYAEALHRKNDACRVTYTAAIEDLYPFHQQILKLTKGRYFTQEEYDSRAKVCILSERIAGMLDLDVGDRIPLEVFRASGDLYDSDAYSKTDEGSYEIVGIQSNEEAWTCWIFLPDRAAAGGAVKPVNGYTLGQFRLRNAGAASFLNAAAPLMERGFRLNLYDQGYAAATDPMQELLFISILFLAVCLLLALCGLALQSHIFISRQRETALTMAALGSGRGHVCVYFLAAALALTAAAAGLGAWLGKLLERRVFTLLREFAVQFANQDLRFSSARLAILRTLEFAPRSSAGPYLAAAGSLLLGSLLFTLCFAAGSLREQERKAKPSRQSRPKARRQAVKTSHLSGFFKYGLLSIRRGAVRTASVVLMGMMAALFFGRLTDSMDGYKTQLAVYQENAEITGSATDFYGKQTNGLVLRAHPIARLQASGLVEHACVTTDLGHIQILGPVGGEQIPFEWPTSSFGYETAFDRLYRGPAWTGTSSVVFSPLFHYSKGGTVDWAEGCSDPDFARTERASIEIYNSYMDRYDVSWYETGPAICALPHGMMEELGIRLGDEIDAICAFYQDDNPIFLPVRLTVAAAYTASTSSTTVYSPLNFVRPGMEQAARRDRNPSGDGDVWIRGELWTQAELEAAEALGMSPKGSFSSYTFGLTEAGSLDAMREAMSEAGYTWVHSGDRKSNNAVLDDEIYLNTVHSMERQIQYVGVLYQALYLMAGIIGFALAWLLVQSRRKEIAVLRALGTPPLKLAANFVAEQFLLILLGLGLGVGVSRLTGAVLRRDQLILTALFLAVWVLSSGTCLIVGLLKRSYAALTEPE